MAFLHNYSVGFPPVANPCDMDTLFLVVNFVHNAVLPDANSIQAFVSHQLADTGGAWILSQPINRGTNTTFDLQR